MNTAIAFWRAQLSTSEIKVFDWDKAAHLIKDNNVKIAQAGLEDDWEWTGGTIFDGRPLSVEESYTYLASNHATPQIVIDDVEHDCWCYQSEHPEWDSGTRWPQSALDILNKTFNC